MEKRVISPEKLEEFYHNPAVWKKVKEYMKVTGGGIPSWHLPDMSEEEFVELLERCIKEKKDIEDMIELIQPPSDTIF